MSLDLIDQFSEEKIVSYRGEEYLVRDNGAIFRLPRPDKKKRPLDEKWTFGNPSRCSGYMTFSTETVHRIVATAFHGEQPSEQHIVDHIDTNRRNNRADNLRWITRLENILENPITRRKIEIAYGSIDDFFDNPKKPRHGALPKNFDWMRTLSREEANAYRKRSLKWAESKKEPNGVKPGEWMFRTNNENVVILDEVIVESLTPNATQKNWRTPCKFLLCPQELEELSLAKYALFLQEGRIFARNQYGESTVVQAQLYEDKSFISVITLNNNVKPFAVAKIAIESDKYCHESCGSFFTLVGAQKQHFHNLGLQYDDIEECIDDFC